MYDDNAYEHATSLNEDQKVEHYQSVLTLKSEDRDFLLSLPDPRPFNHFLEQTRQYLHRFPLALIGEVGLDKSFRIPEAWLPGHEDKRNDGLTPGGREGRRLSPYRVSMEHQKQVLLAQLHLAGEMQRAVSCHGVQAHGVVYETLAETWRGHERKPLSKRERKKQEAAAKVNAEPEESLDDHEELPGPKLYPPRICLHSYSGPAETVKQYIAPTVPCEIFFSFSTTINAWSDPTLEGKHVDGKVEQAVKAVPDDRILVESDLHTAGERMDGYLEAGVRKICEVKKWELDDGVKRLGANWKKFVLGNELGPQ